jgi:hypothetical protein
MIEDEQARASRPVRTELHKDLLRLAKAVGLDSFLTDNNHEDDYSVVVEEAISRIECLSSSAVEQAVDLQRIKRENMFKQDQIIFDKSKQFEEELRNAISTVENRGGWQEKYKRLIVKIRKEKSQNKVLEEFVQSQNKKIAVLVDHVDKLMRAIKLESAKRMKLIDENRKLRQQEEVSQNRIDKQSRIITIQQR